MLTKTNKIPEKSKTQNFKTPKQYFCEDHWEEILEKVWEDSKEIWGRSSVLKFWLPYGPMLTKTKKNPKKSKKKNFFFSKMKKNVWGYGPGEARTEIWKQSMQ